MQHERRTIVRSPRLDEVQGEDLPGQALSPAQEGMLFQSALSANCGIYVQQIVCALDEELDAQALRGAWAQTVERHAGLRVAFPLREDDRPVQVVASGVVLPWLENDWRGLDALDSRLERWLVLDRERGFDTRQAPLMRAALFRFGETEHRFVWTFHHALLDGRSHAIILAEAFGRHDAARGRAPFVDHAASPAVWPQLRRSATREHPAGPAFWRDELAGFTAPTASEIGRAPLSQPAGAAVRAAVATRLSETTTSALRACGWIEGFTLGTAVAAAWALVLGRYAGTDDVVIGTTRALPVGSRRAERRLGVHINTTPLRIRLPADMPAKVWLAAVRRRWLASRAHVETPLTDIQGASELPRGVPLFDTIVVYDEQRLDSRMRTLSDAWATRQVALRQATHYALALGAYGEAALALEIDYDARRFERGAIERLLGHLGVVLEAFARDPGQRLEAIPLMSEEERAEMLARSQGPIVESSAGRRLDTLFQAQAARTPEGVAVRFEQGQLSYAELERRSSSLARALRARGVAPGDLVGVLLERSLELPIGALACLGAQAVYVPIDATWPTSRVESLARDVGLRHIICHASRRTGLDHIDWVPLDGDGPMPPPHTAPTGRAAAYAMFTSGSRGRPNAVLCAHDSVVNLLDDFQARRSIGPGDRASLFTSIGFDVSVYEIFAALLSGATLDIVPESVRADGAALASWILARGIGSAYVPPHALPALAHALETNPGRSRLCRLLVGVEPISEALLSRIAASGDVTVINGYGPTEATICATLHDSALRAGRSGRVPIGRPVRNTRSYVLDAGLRLQPVGVAGELFIGGDGLALGYLGRPELDAERFVADPFAADPDCRLYRTGDRVRWLEDGELEFLGRLDDQIKIRGVRIEPGEIEAALTADPAVREAAVVVRAGADGTPRLVAYLVARQGAIDTSTTRKRLREQLPEALIPQLFVVLDALPLTPSGKLDRGALPAPAEPRPAPLQPPGSATEALVAGVFAEVLGVATVGREESFFDLGGHSLLAAVASTRISRLAGVEIAIGAIFEAPTVEALASRVEAAARDQRATPSQTIVSEPGRTALSLGQERLWFLDRMGGDPARYHLAYAARVRGPLHLDALRVALAGLVQRHEALRTSIRGEGGGAVAVVLPAERWLLAVEDLAGAPDPAAALELRLVEEARRPFDLACEAPLRARSFRLGPEAHVIALVLHHVGVDGWSMRVVWRDLWALYGEAVTGRPAALPTLPIRYSDFARWQREAAASSAAARGLDYWREQLAGAPASLELPFDRARPRIESGRGATVRLGLEAAVVAPLRALCASEGATLFMGLLAAFQTLLARVTGQSDVVVGTAMANRGRPETEHLVGFLVGTLALRTRLGDAPTFREALRRAREAALGAYAHQEVPFEKVVAALAPTRALDRSPVFQAMLVLQPSAASRLWPAGLEVELEEVHTRTAKLDLTVSLTETADRLDGVVEYATDLFDASTVSRLAAHFATLLSSAIADPDRTIGSLTMLPPDERRRVVEEWNDTAAELPVETTLAAAVEAQIDRTPDATALIFEGARLSFAELERRANRVANRLRALGAGPETLVALALERSFELVIGMLGVLKAGAAFVPVDPRHPDEPLRFVLADTAAPLLVTQARFAARMRDLGAPTLLVIDVPDGELAGAATSRPPAAAGPRNTAYVLYTSGSTGRPKGVVVEHRSILNHLLWRRASFPPEPDERILHKTPYTFDVSLWELFLPLLGGHALVIARPDGHRDPAYLVRLIREQAVTTLHFVPSMLHAFLEADGLESLTRLRRVCLSGEAVTVELVERFFQRLPRAELWNLYGPTEAAIDVSSWRCTAGSGRRTVPMGRPIANTQLYVLDPYGEPTPIGVAGELHIGGISVARGYLRRPELTAERFVPDRFSRHAEARLYRTGDRARWLADGNLEFLGRLDDQVKIRGVRIEPGEVETTLLGDPAVREAAVVVQPGPDGAPSLVAYVVARGAPLDADALKARLGLKLPPAYLPSAFVMLDALPLTTSGKLDRKALPLPIPPSARGHAADAPPLTPTEALVSAIFGEVLAVDGIGASDDFFALGGHSLLAMRTLARLERGLSIELPLRALFEAPTVAKLAARIDAERGAGKLAPIAPSADDEPPPPSLGQERLWFLDQLGGERSRYNLAWAVRITGPLSPSALGEALSALLERHESLRTTLVVVGGRLRQVINAPAPVVLPELDLGGLGARDREAEVARHLEAAAARAFDLAADPLLRAQLLRLGPNEWVLALQGHHSALDGWSVGVLFRELGALYRAFSRGEPSPLEPLAIRYADFARWQRRALCDGPVLEALLRYWRARLAQAPLVLQLPTDRPRPAVETHRGGSVRMQLSTELAAGLRRLCRAEGVTLFMGLLAGLQALLARYTGASDVLIGTPVADRRRIETEGLIGFFLNTIVLRGDLSGDPSFRGLLARVRQRTLDDFSHQDLPFERLVQDLQPPRDLSRGPIFQVMFVLHHAEATPVFTDDLRVSVAEAPGRTSKLDLTLAITEAPDGALTALLEHNADLFEPDTAERMLGHYRELLAGAVADPDCALSRLPLLTAAERERELSSWNDTDVPPGRDGLYALFEAQVARTPAAEALRAGGESLSYRALAVRVRRLARELAASGAGPGVLVGLLAHGGLDRIVALLAIVASGAAFVPLDPADPAERNAFIITDAGVALLVAGRRAELPVHAAKVIFVGASGSRGDEGAPIPAFDWCAAPGPDDVAYVIYTSGSTGRPKGVEATQRGVLNRLAWMARRYPYAGDDVACHKTSIGFVDAVQEIFGPLLAGVPLVVAPSGIARDPEALVQLLADEGVTRLVAVPSLIRSMLERYPDLGARLPRLRMCVSSGEALPADLARRLHASCPGIRLLNLYGSSEVAGDATWTEVHPEAAVVSVGRPIDNTRVYLLDDAMNPVPVGVTGELHVGGAGLARGYLRRPELTRERFVASPFGAGVHARVFKTGDLGRRLGDGSIEILGRRDHRLKLRGYRIEPAEVEAALAQVPGIAAACVVARADASGQPQLVAYIVPRDPACPPALDAVRAELDRSLPEYMIPSRFLGLDALPLGASGKLDRDALPAAAPPLDAAHARAGPRDEREERLAAIWQRLFERPVGVRDDFFMLGGHSLQAVRLFAEIEDAFHVKLPLAVLFERATIEHLAARIAQLESRRGPVAHGGPRSGSAAPVIVSMREGGSAPPLFCVHGVGGDIFAFLELARCFAPGRPIYGIRAPALLPARLEQLAATYAERLSRLVPEGSVHLCGYSLGGSLALETARCLAAEGRRAGLVGIIDQPFPGARYLGEAPTTVGDLVRLLAVARSRGPRHVLRSAVRWLSERYPGARGDDGREPAVHGSTGDATAALLAMQDGYRPAPYGGPLVLFRARTQRLLSRHTSDLGWRQFATGGLDIVPIAGDHQTMMIAPAVGTMAAALDRRLRRLDGETDPIDAPRRSIGERIDEGSDEGGR